MKDGSLKVKETMTITMISEDDVLDRPFETSHLLTKLRRTVVVARIWENQEEARSIYFKSIPFDLDDRSVYSQVAQDYELVRRTIKGEGFEALTGKMGPCSPSAQGTSQYYDASLLCPDAICRQNTWNWMALRFRTLAVCFRCFHLSRDLTRKFGGS